jgi:tRNA 2-thiouridine synthesizing protein D
MRITLVVHHPADPHALRFARAAVDKGHEIPLVFFYHDGVRAADENARGTDQELWRDFSTAHSVPLAVCISAAARRGLIEESSPTDGRVRDGFDVVGLGQFIGAAAESDRLITFAG